MQSICLNFLLCTLNPCVLTTFVFIAHVLLLTAHRSLLIAHKIAYLTCMLERFHNICDYAPSDWSCLSLKWAAPLKVGGRCILRGSFQSWIMVFNILCNFLGTNFSNTSSRLLLPLPSILSSISPSSNFFLTFLKTLINLIYMDTLIYHRTSIKRTRSTNSSPLIL